MKNLFFLYLLICNYLTLKGQSRVPLDSLFYNSSFKIDQYNIFLNTTGLEKPKKLEIGHLVKDTVVDFYIFNNTPNEYTLLSSFFDPKMLKSAFKKHLNDSIVHLDECTIFEDKYQFIEFYIIANPFFFELETAKYNVYPKYIRLPSYSKTYITIPINSSELGNFKRKQLSLLYYEGSKLLPYLIDCFEKNKSYYPSILKSKKIITY